MLVLQLVDLLAPMLVLKWVSMLELMSAAMKVPKWALKWVMKMALQWVDL